MKSQELREQRAKLIANARVIIDHADADSRELTAEEKAQVDGMFSQADSMADQAEDAERKEKLAKAEAELRESQGRKTKSTRFSNSDLNPEDRKKAIRSWALAGTGKFNADDELRAANYGINLRSGSLEVRALSKGTNTAGGHTVPVAFASEIEKQLKYYSEIRNVAKVLTTDSGADLDYPRVSDISNVAAIVGEAGSIATNVDPTFDKVTVKAWKYASPTVLVSLELLQDSAVDIEALLADLLAERMARGQEAHFIGGNGTTQPEGLNSVSASVELASGNALTFDKVIDLVHSVDRAYRSNSAFLMHDTTLAQLRKVKDDNNNYIWQPSVQVGEPDRIFGYPVYVSNQLEPWAANIDETDKIMLFGDMSKYLIRDVGPSLSVARLDQLYMATGQIGFVLLMRTDGRYIGHTGCVKAMAGYNTP